MAKLLIVDDEKAIRELIKKYALFEGFEVDEAEGGMEALLKARENNDYDLIVLDIMMPEMDGFTVARELRKTSTVPIIMLSARNEEYDRIHGFENGVDDYVTKPFSPRELIMRINAVLRRASAQEEPQQEEAPHEIFELEGIKIDFTARIVYIDGVETDMSPKEYELLFYMVNNKNIALTRERLINDVWGYDFYGEDRTLDTHIKLLRKRLGKYSSHIVTLRRVGYRFDC